MNVRLVACWSLHVQGDFHIGAWLIQPQLHTIARDDQITHVEPKAMQVLVYLAEHADQVVSKERLISAVWADTFVTDDVLTRCISELRKAFGDDPRNPEVIETIPRGGYRLLASVEPLPAEPVSAAASSSPRRWPLWAAAIAEALGLALLVLALNSGGARTGRLNQSPATAVPTLVVLPLENLSGDPGQDYFADGMTQELTTYLAKISALNVISRNSAVHYRVTTKSIPQVARELGVDAVVVGTVQRAGDRVRISVELVDGRSDRHLWAESYERDLRDVLDLQASVADAIAQQIRTTLAPAERAAPPPAQMLAGVTPTISPEAYEAYLRGNYFWSKLTEEGARKSIEYYQKAIQLAPGFAPAYAALAFSYNLLASSEFEPPRENYAKAKQLAQQALEKDPNLSEAHAALGFALCWGDWDLPAAEAELKRALDLNPKSDTAHHVHALFLGAMGRTDEALAEMKKSLELNPLDILARWNLGWLYLEAGKPDPAVEQFQKILEIAPNSPDGHHGLGMAYVFEGRYTKAISETQKAMTLGTKDDSSIRATLGFAYAVAGKKADAIQVLNNLKLASKRKYVPAYFIAGIYAGLDDKDSAFGWLAKALEERDDQMVELKVDPIFASLRSDPRFGRLLARIGLP